tara:strand:+ start:209 stop:517 length:309 start_codon:yes stop_codon:yes gene_type:complete
LEEMHNLLTTVEQVAVEQVFLRLLVQTENPLVLLDIIQAAVAVGQEAVPVEVHQNQADLVEMVVAVQQNKTQVQTQVLQEQLTQVVAADQTLVLVAMPVDQE